MHFQAIANQQQPHAFKTMSTCSDNKNPKAVPADADCTDLEAGRVEDHKDTNSIARTEDTVHSDHSTEAPTRSDAAKMCCLLLVLLVLAGTGYVIAYKITEEQDGSAVGLAVDADEDSVVLPNMHIP